MAPGIPMAMEFIYRLNNRLAKGVVAILLVAGFGGWFLLSEQKIRKEAWKGVVTEKWEKKRFITRSSGSRPMGNRNRYSYYWRVTKDDGSNAEVKVPYNLYVSGNPGTRIEKIFSQRYPRIAQ